jgi:Cu+-exporting ATPase
LKTDPVCGMQVADDAPRSFVHDGVDYRFCSDGCRGKFAADPQHFLAKESSSGAHPAPATQSPTGQWTCPMHPEIIRDAPGSCPKCGMALEPLMPAGDDEANPELDDMTRRFRVATALALPLLAVAMGDMLPGHPVSSLVSPRVRVWVEFALATPVCLWAAWPFHVRAWQSVRNRSLNMFTLIGLGIAVAYLFSVAASLFSGMFPASVRTHGGAVPVYYESAT